MKTNKIIAILTALSVISLTRCVLAQNEEGIIPKIWRKVTTKKDSTQLSPISSQVYEKNKYPTVVNNSMVTMTKEEMIQEIKSEIENYEEILSKIPEIKKHTDKDGKVSYLYSEDAQGMNLEDLDSDKLKELLDKVYLQANIYQANMVAEQIEAVRESQRVSSMQQQMPYRPPFQPPRPPSPPPQPPRRN